MSEPVGLDIDQILQAPITVPKAIRDMMLCSNCRKRPGQIRWGDSLAITHGWADMRCGVCVYRAQLGHALARAVRIPLLTTKLVWSLLRRR